MSLQGATKWAYHPTAQPKPKEIMTKKNQKIWFNRNTRHIQQCFGVKSCRLQIASSALHVPGIIFYFISMVLLCQLIAPCPMFTTIRVLLFASPAACLTWTIVLLPPFNLQKHTTWLRSQQRNNAKPALSCAVLSWPRDRWHLCICPDIDWHPTHKLKRFLKIKLDPRRIYEAKRFAQGRLYKNT